MRDDAADQVVGGVRCSAAVVPLHDGCSGHSYRGAFEEVASFFL